MRALWLAPALLLAPLAALAQIGLPAGQAQLFPQAGAACPGSTNFDQDNFTGTNGTLLSAHTETGGSTTNGWTKQFGPTDDIKLNGSGGIASTGTTDNVVYSDNGTPTCANYTVTGSIAAPTSSQAGLVCRLVDGNNFYLALRNGFGGTYVIYKKVAGSFTSLASVTDPASPNGAPTMNFTCNGTTLTLAVPSSSISFSATDSTFASAGKAGVLINSGATITTFSAK